MDGLLNDAGAKVDWTIAVLNDVRLYSSLTMQHVSIQVGRKSPSFIADIESGRFAKVSFLNVLALCNVYDINLQFILTLYDQRKKVTLAATRRWLKAIDVDAVGFDENGRKDVLRGIEQSDNFCLRVAVAKALMEEYGHIHPMETLALSAVVGALDWKFSI